MVIKERTYKLPEGEITLSYKEDCIVVGFPAIQKEWQIANAKFPYVMERLYNIACFTKWRTGKVILNDWTLRLGAIWETTISFHMDTVRREISFTEEKHNATLVFSLEALATIYKELVLTWDRRYFCVA